MRSRSTPTINALLGSLPSDTTRYNLKLLEISKSKKALIDAPERTGVVLTGTALLRTELASTSGLTRNSLSLPREAKVPNISHRNIIVNSLSNRGNLKIMLRHLLLVKLE